jgi:hypothetical protein
VTIAVSTEKPRSKTCSRFVLKTNQTFLTNVKLAERGMQYGCPHAVRCKLCPFVGTPDEVRSRIARIETFRRRNAAPVDDVENLVAPASVGAGSSSEETAMNRCRSACARYLTSFVRRDGIRVPAVFGPGHFYCVAIAGAPAPM